MSTSGVNLGGVGVGVASRRTARDRFVGIADIVVPALLALVFAVALSMWAPLGADWPAQVYRAYIGQHGLNVWTNYWYDGNALPGYSLLYPLVAAMSNAAVVGVGAVVCSAACAAALGPRDHGWRQVTFTIGVLLCLLESFMIGQLAFLAGLAPAIGCLVALRYRKSRLTAVLAALSSLFSPLAGLFLVIAAVALLRTLGWRRVAPMGTATLGTIVSAVIDSGGGPFSYELKSLEAVAIFAAVTWLVTTRRDRALRDFVLAYLLVSIALYVVANPVGGNMNRLGKMVALPLALIFVASQREWTIRRAGALIGIGLAAWWSFIPFAVAVHRGFSDPAKHQAYFAPLRSYLQVHDPELSRVEIPFTSTHWEASYVAQFFPLARGWERQDDKAYNGVLYTKLTADIYHRWLADNAVAFVALPTVALDSGGIPERRLLSTRLPYLHKVWSTADWTVWRVNDATPLVTGDADLVALRTASVTLHFRRAGRALVRIHASPMWASTSRDGSVGRSRAGWLVVRADGAGDVTIRARLRWGVLNPFSPLR